MVTPVKERIRKMRERFQAEGMVRVEVVLPRELIERCQRPGETISTCIQRALLQSVSGNRTTRKPLHDVSGNNIVVDQHRVSGNTPPNLPVSGNSRESIIDWIIVAKDAMRLSYQKIADALNAQGIQTFSGKGTWAKGNVERFYKGKTD